MTDPDAASHDLRRRLAWLDAAAVVARAVLAEPGGDIRRLATTQAKTAARADTTGLVVMTCEPSELTTVVSAGLGAEVYEDLTFLARDSALGRAIIAGESVLVEQILPWATDHDDAPNPMRLGPAMTLPLRDRHGRNAALVLARTTDRPPFDPRERDFAAPFAEFVSLALRQAGERASTSTTMTTHERDARDRAVQVLHEELTQRLFAVGVGLQSVLELGTDDEAARRLKGYLAELDEMIDLLRRDGLDGPAPPSAATPATA